MIVFPVGRRRRRRRRRSARDLLSFLSLFSFLPFPIPIRPPSAGPNSVDRPRRIVLSPPSVCASDRPTDRGGAADRARGGSAAERRAKKSGRDFVSLRINVSPSADGGEIVKVEVEGPRSGLGTCDAILGEEGCKFGLSPHALEGKCKFVL